MKIFVSCGSSNNIDEMYKYKSEYYKHKHMLEEALEGRR